MVSDPVVDVSYFDEILLHTLPQIVINDLAKTLNKSGPSNWKVLQNNICSSGIGNIFRQEDINQFEQYPEDDSSPFLFFLCQHGVSAGFLLHYLKTLSCSCSLKTFRKHLYKLIPLESETYVQMMPGISLPVYAPHTYHGHTMYQMSLPALSNNDHLTGCIRILEQPNDLYKLKKGDPITVRCRVESRNKLEISFQWYHMFTPLPDQKKTILMIPEATPQHQGYYCCQIKTKTPHPVVVKSQWAFVSIGVDDSDCFATDKVALLIANEHYANHKRLPATLHDIQVLTDILQNELNFKTLSFVNLSFAETHKALQWLCEMCKKGSYCVFYFGGHGFESDGMCHLVPTDAPSPFKNSDCINAFRELENIQRRCEPELLLVLSDICRKRNPKDCPTTQNPPTFKPNVVLAYATTDTRVAYEICGAKHGIFVDSLRKHITKAERVNHMLSPVQDEVGRSFLQVAEVKSTLLENRCLTDRILPDKDSVAAQSKWLWLHEKMKNEPLITQVGSKAMIELRYRSLLTNKVEISVRVVSQNEAFKCGAYIDPRCFRGIGDVTVSTPAGVDVPPNSMIRLNVLQVSNLQKLKHDSLAISVILQYQSPETGKLYRQSYQEILKPRLITLWR